MRVCISSFGRFHTFDLARQMERLGHLERVYTGYPGWKLDGMPHSKVNTFPWFLVPQLALERMGLARGRTQLTRWAIETFDRWVARNLTPCEVFHSLSSFGLLSHKLARSRGALTVCDRGSSHIAFQDEILAQEHERWGVPYRPIDPRIVERELAEYDACDLIFVPSTFAYRSFVEKGVPEGKLRKNPYGVDLDLFKPVEKEDRAFRVICVGTLSLQKGTLYLLEAVAGLELPSLELWLIGSVAPEMRALLSKYQDRFRYLGVIPRKELYRYYSQASVFVIPSVQDGFGLVQAQAMACGLPVIATTNTGAEDLFDDGKEGFIVPIRSAEAIRERIVYLYEHPEVCEEMSAAALRRVQLLRGWNSYGEAAMSLYSAALGSAPIESPRTSAWTNDRN